VHTGVNARVSDERRERAVRNSGRPPSGFKTRLTIAEASAVEAKTLTAARPPAPPVAASSAALAIHSLE
jgi:hypothetical protein